MKKAIFMGKTECGKTTLIHRLENGTLDSNKTQMIEHYVNFIDTPGEYLEQRSMYKALIVTSADADVIGLVQECGQENSWIPPSFASTFAKPVIGIVSKCDLAQSDEEIAFAKDILRQAGVERIFVVSSVAGEGLDDLIAYLSDE